MAALGTAPGGGKTHTLIALYRIAKGGSRTPGADALVSNLKFEPVKVANVIHKGSILVETLTRNLLASGTSLHESGHDWTRLTNP